MAEPEPQTGDTSLPSPITTERIAAWMRSSGYHYMLDEDGHLVGLWGPRLFYFLLEGDGRQVVQVRGHWGREAAIEWHGDLLETCNRWNAESIWPKAYTRVRDNGMVHVLAEVTTEFADGATDAQLGQVLACGLETSMMFFDALDREHPDPLRTAP